MRVHPAVTAAQPCVHRARQACVGAATMLIVRMMNPDSLSERSFSVPRKPLFPCMFPRRWAFVPESPRWLLTKGRFQEGPEVVGSAWLMRGV